MEFKGVIKMSTFKELLNTKLNEVKDSSELDTFLQTVKKANELLTDASVLVSKLTSLHDSGLKSQAQKLEKLIDASRDYAFKIR